MLSLLASWSVLDWSKDPQLYAVFFSQDCICHVTGLHGCGAIYACLRRGYASARRMLFRWHWYFNAHHLAILYWVNRRDNHPSRKYIDWKQLNVAQTLDNHSASYDNLVKIIIENGSVWVVWFGRESAGKSLRSWGACMGVCRSGTKLRVCYVSKSCKPFQAAGTKC